MGARTPWATYLTPPSRSAGPLFGTQYSNTYFGNGVGTYILNGGSTGGEATLLGEGGTAIFTQTGGTNNCQSHFWLGGAQTTSLSSWYPQADNGSGYATGGTSTYSLSGGILLGPGAPQGGGSQPYGELIGDAPLQPSSRRGEPTLLPKFRWAVITRPMEEAAARIAPAPTISRRLAPSRRIWEQFYSRVFPLQFHRRNASGLHGRIDGDPHTDLGVHRPIHDRHEWYDSDHWDPRHQLVLNPPLRRPHEW